MSYGFDPVPLLLIELGLPSSAGLEPKRGLERQERNLPTSCQLSGISRDAQWQQTPPPRERLGCSAWFERVGRLGANAACCPSFLRRQGKAFARSVQSTLSSAAPTGYPQSYRRLVLLGPARGQWKIGRASSWSSWPPEKQLSKPKTTIILVTF